VWSGSRDQTARAAEDFRISVEKVWTDDEDYTMNHTSSVFLVDPSGRFTTTIDYHEARDFAVPKIRRALKRREDDTS